MKDENQVSAINKKYVAALGKAVRSYRTLSGKSQEQAAHDADMHTNYFQAIELGNINTSISKIVAIAGALDVSAGEIVTKADETYNSGDE